MTNEEYTEFEKFVKDLWLKEGLPRIQELEAQVVSLTDDVTHLQGQVRALQVSNSALHQWNIDHSFEHDQERLKLKQRVQLTRERLDEANTRLVQHHLEPVSTAGL